MGYFEDLKNLLLPLGVYSLTDGGNTAELAVLGKEFDEVEAVTKLIENESSVITAENYGLESYEKLMPHIPSYQSLKSRRNAITALLRIDDSSFTTEALNETLSGCGVKAVVRETDAKYIVEVSFPETRGIPKNLAILDKRVKEILPCHLDIQYKYVFLIWDELETYFKTWDMLEERNFIWDELEVYYAEE